MIMLHPFAILITAAFLASAQAGNPAAGNLAVGTKIPTLQLLNGRSYENATVTKIDDEGVSIQHQGGLHQRGAKAAATAEFRVVGTDGNGQPIQQEIPQSLDGIAGGLETDMGGANMQANLGRMAELGISCQELSNELRKSIAAIAKRDQPIAAVLRSPFSVGFVAPGMLSVTNQSGKTLNNCQFSTATTLSIPSDGIDHHRVAGFLMPLVGYSREFSQEAEKRRRLEAKLAAMERGFLVFVPKLRDQETVTIPFCDMPSMPAAAQVHISLWTDEFTGENAPVAGLQALKDQLETEAKARWERQQANAQRARKPQLNNGGRVNLAPKIPRDPNNPLHQGNGARMFNR